MTPEQAGLAIAALIDEGYLRFATRWIPEIDRSVTMTDEVVVSAPITEDRVKVLETMRAGLAQLAESRS